MLQGFPLADSIQTTIELAFAYANSIEVCVLSARGNSCYTLH